MRAFQKSFRALRLVPAALLVALLLPIPVAASSTFIAVADGQWINPATWGGMTPPTSGATVSIPAGRQVYIGTENELHIDRTTLTVDGTLLVNGPLYAGPGTNITINTGTLDDASLFSIEGGCIDANTCPPAPVLTNHGTLTSRASTQLKLGSYTSTVNTGAIINAGTLLMTQQGILTNSGSVTNTGTIDGQGYAPSGFFYYSEIDNSGTLTNGPGAVMNWGGTLLNTGLFMNQGSIDVNTNDNFHRGAVANNGGTIDNYGTITAASDFRNVGTSPASLIRNRAGALLTVSSARAGILSGRLLNDKSGVVSITGVGWLTNRAVIENDGSIQNGNVLDNNGTGQIGVRCNGTYNGNAPTGNAPLAWCLQMGVSPASLSFEDVALGASSASQRLTLTNLADAGAGDINVGLLAVQGLDAGDFSLGDDLCSNSNLAPGATCTVDVTFSPTAAGGLTANLTIPSNALFAPKVVPLKGNSPLSVVVSQVLGARFDSAYTNSFIELFNRGSTPVDLTGWSVQYPPFGPGQWQKTDLPSVSLGGGQYLLVEEAASPFGTTALPTPDAIGTIDISEFSGVVALLSNQTTIPLGTTCPTANVVDLVGYGPTQCFEGVGAAQPALGANLGELRLGGGCVDTDSNLPDFKPGTPNPRNSASPTVSCATALLPHLGAAPTSLDFGSVVVGSASLSQRLTITNTAAPGSAALGLGQLLTEGADANDFSLSNDLCSNQNLGAGVSCTVDIRFAPGATGSRHASISIPSNAVTNPDQVLLSGTGAAAVPPPAQITVTPAFVNFGIVPIGDSVPRQVTITNSGLPGAALLEIGQLTETGDAGDYPLDHDTCSGTSLAAGASCTVGVTFGPTAVGLRSANLDVPSDALFGSSGVALVGSGLPGPFNVTGAASTSSTSISVTFSDAPNALQATQLANFSVPGLILTGTPTLSANTVTIATSSQLAQSYTVTVANVARASDGAILLTNSATFTGTPPPPQPVASVSPPSLAFGSQSVGTTGATQTITVTSTGLASLTITGTSLTGSNAADFVVTSNACTNAVLAPSASCSIDLAFKPTAIGARSAVLRISDDSAGSPHDVSLSGTGTAPIAQVAPTSIDFGTVNTGSSSAHRTVTVTDTGNQALAITAAAITGPNAADFAIAADSCTTPGLVGPGASCTMELTFSPAAPGGRSATLSLTTNAAGSPQTVSLWGTGVAAASADLAVSISASPNPAKTGQRVTYTITLLNAGPSTATAILINDTLSSQSTFVSATITGGSCVTPVKGASGVVSCSLASLASGASKPITIVVTVIAKKTSITNTVTVSSATADPNLANNTASITTRVK
jgi:uncharacterized repeat protein (TIGR01451 family)